MRYADIKYNDVANGIGVNVSLWVQGCPHHCEGCFNQETWDFNKGKLFTQEQIELIIQKIKENNILRNFSILGGEPLADLNKKEVLNIILRIKKEFPKIKIYLWTGYTLDFLIKKNDSEILTILQNIDFLIDGRFEKDKSNYTLKLRGSSNQHIYQIIDNSIKLIE